MEKIASRVPWHLMKSATPPSYVYINFALLCTKEGAWVRSKNCAFFQLSNSQIVSSEVLIFCVEFQELSHLTRDLSQAEKKIDVITYKLSKCTKWHLFYSKWMKLSFWVKIVAILSVAQLKTTVIFFSAWNKSHVKWDNSRNEDHNWLYTYSF